VLFHADHKNLITKGMDTDGLNESRKTMRLQTDANGDPINVIPAYILVPAALEGSQSRCALIFLAVPGRSGRHTEPEPRHH
jgi:phage major head subunit gpT-like protein